MQRDGKCLEFPDDFDKYMTLKSLEQIKLTNVWSDIINVNVLNLSSTKSNSDYHIHYECVVHDGIDGIVKCISGTQGIMGNCGFNPKWVITGY